MIGETILARTSARCKQAYNWRDHISLIIGLQSASWWSVNIYCTNYWLTIGAPIIVPPILARLSAIFFNSANPTWDNRRSSEYTERKNLIESKRSWPMRYLFAANEIIYLNQWYILLEWPRCLWNMVPLNQLKFYLNQVNVFAWWNLWIAQVKITQ